MGNLETVLAVGLVSSLWLVFLAGIFGALNTVCDNRGAGNAAEFFDKAFVVTGILATMSFLVGLTAFTIGVAKGG